MNYNAIYESLILRALSRKLPEETYTEKHHIIPKCLGGTNAKQNLCRLLPEEHYIAHMLLVKIYPEETKLWYASNMMAGRTNKHYAWFRSEFSKRHSAFVKANPVEWSDARREAMSRVHKGVPKSEEFKENQRIIRTKVWEYKGKTYSGFVELKNDVGVSYHLYHKYYLNGVDPEPYINNCTWGMLNKHVQ